MKRDWLESLQVQMTVEIVFQLDLEKYMFVESCWEEKRCCDGGWDIRSCNSA